MKLALWKLAAWMVAVGLACGEDNSPSTQKKPGLIMIPAGISITVRVDEALSSKKNDAGDRFTGFGLWILLVRSVVAFGQPRDWMKPMLAAVVLFAILWRTLCIEPEMGS